MVHTTTYLDMDSDRGLQILRERAVERSLSHEAIPDGLALHLPWGDIHAVKVKSGLRLTLRADDRARLFSLQEVVDKRLDEAGIEPDRHWSFSEPGGLPPNLTFAEVDEVSRLCPSYYRVRLRSTDLDRFMREALHFRILFPPDSHRGEWPKIGNGGRIEWPGGMTSWHRPVYTARIMDPQRATLEFDVFDHNGGRMAEWCRAVRKGDEVAIMGPGTERYPRARWLALFGDETALPTIARILEERPADSIGSATILVSDTGDIQEIGKPDQVEINWLIRGENPSLIDAVCELEIPQTDRFIWFAGERSEAGTARRILLKRGLDSSEIRTSTYWSR